MYILNYHITLRCGIKYVQQSQQSFTTKESAERKRENVRATFKDTRRCAPNTVLEFGDTDFVAAEIAALKVTVSECDN